MLKGKALKVCTNQNVPHANILWIVINVHIKLEPNDWYQIFQNKGIQASNPDAVWIVWQESLSSKRKYLLLTYIFIVSVNLIAGI